MNYKLIQQILTESVDTNLADYIVFVKRVMDDENFHKSVSSLHPFDGVVHREISFPSSSLTLGFSIMRMGIGSETFALGVTLTMDATPILEKPYSVIIYLSAAKTFDEMRAYVNTVQFKEEVKEYFHQQIEGAIVNAARITIHSVD